jgi:hypothetical protein
VTKLVSHFLRMALWISARNAKEIAERKRVEDTVKAIDELMSRPPPESQREMAALSPGRTLNDVEAILAAVPLAQRVTAEVGIPNGARLYFQGRATGQAVRGVLPATFIMDRFEVAQGRLIGELDLELQTQVVVLGASIAEYLFPRGLDPLDRVITINGLPFTVCGVLKEYHSAGSSGGGSSRVSSKNSAVFIPLTTAQTLFRIDENVDVIHVQLADIAETLGLPVENLISPDTVRRLCWSPPRPAWGQRRRTGGQPSTGT